MKAKTVRDYLSVHTWTGILCGMMLFVAFYAGALSMFEVEITRWAQVDQDRRGASRDADALLTRYLSENPGPVGQLTLVLGAVDDSPPYLEASEGRRGPSQRFDLDASGSLRRLAGSAEGETGDFVDTIHRKGGLPLPLEVAEPVIGFVSLGYAIALISGIVVLLPSLVRDLFTVRIGRNIKRMWLDLHNLIGVASLPFHLVIALTAAIFGLHDWIYGAQSAVIYPGGLGSAVARAEPVREPVPLDVRAWLPPSELVSRARAAAPGFEPVGLSYRGAGKADGTIFMAGTDDRHFTRASRYGVAVVDPATGGFLARTYLPGQEDTTAASFLNSFFALHFGSYGGPPVRLLYVLLGVLGALLFYTGNVLWIESRTRRLRQGGQIERPRHVRWVAALNVGVCLGCVAGLSAAIVASRWLLPGGHAPELIHQGSYYAVFALFIVYAFARGAAAATPVLLAAASLLTALIPLTSLVSEIAPEAAPVVARSYAPGFIYVDLLSVAGAALLGWMALQTWRRLPRTPGQPLGVAGRPPPQPS